MAITARRHIWWVIPASLALAFAGQVGFRMIWPETVLTSSAIPGFQPGSLAEVVRKAEVIVRGHVVSVKPGEDVVVQFAQDEHRAQTQLISVEVADVYKGSVTQGAVLSVFQYGGYSPGVRAEVFDVSDPPYLAGRDYLLFLEKGIRGLYIVVSPEGRYLMAADGALQPMVDNRVTGEVRGKQMGIVAPILRRP